MFPTPHQKTCSSFFPFPPPPPPLSRVVDLATLAGPNWLDSSGAGSSLDASGAIGVDQSPPIAPLQPPSPKLPALENSPTWSKILRPVVVPSPSISENDGSSPYYSDSSSHYGSPVLASSERKARPPSLASSSPEVDVVPILASSERKACPPPPASSSPEIVVVTSEAPPVSNPGNANSAPLGPWKNLFASNRSPSSGSQLLHYSELLDAEKCEILNDDLDCACDVWKSCLIGYVSGRFPGFRALKSMIVNDWRCEAVLNVHDSGWLIYKFRNEVDRLAVLKGGPYLVFGRPLILKEMPEFFDFNSAEMCTVPVWIKLPNLPLRCWSLKSLSKIASMVGKPLQSDMLTSSMSRLSYARILIEIDLCKPLRDHIAVSLPNGVIIDQQVIYETLPKFCTHCHVMGHLVASCSKVPNAKAANVLPKSLPAKKVVLPSEGIKSVPISAASAPSLLFEGLQVTRVETSTAGVYDWQPVPRKLTSNRQPKLGLGSPSGLASGKDIPPSAVISVVAADHVPGAADNSSSKGKSVEGMGNVSGAAVLPILGSVDSGATMDVGCKGLPDKLVGADPQSSGTAGLVSGLRQAAPGILGGAPMAPKGLNSPLKQHEVVNLMKKSKVDVCGLLETKLSLPKVLSLQKFRLKKWKFLTNAASSSSARIVVFWNRSTASVDMVGSSSQGLHVLVRSLVSQVELHISFVYGLHTIVARRTLWDSLRDWCIPGPWMVLGDFNSLLSQDDKLNGSAVSMYETADLNKCCLDLGLYDLSYTGCHFSWSNGSVWSKLDRVLVNPHWSSLHSTAHVHFECCDGFPYVLSLQEAKGVEASAKAAEQASF
ncbi:hypothetical protein OIU76_026557 [Salix suchowensis]|nr:hypothetical protein OIU76_026557 [Salix suchowensis]